MKFEVDDMQLALDGAQVIEPVFMAVDEAQHRLGAFRDDVVYLELEPARIKQDLLNMNHGKHHNRFARNAAVKFWKGRTIAAGREWIDTNRVSLPTWDRVRIVITFVYGNLHQRDTHNLMPTAKSVVDGIVALGIVSDDNDKLVMGPDLRPALDRRLGNHGVQLIARVEPLAEDDFLWWEAG